MPSTKVVPHLSAPTSAPSAEELIQATLSLRTSSRRPTPPRSLSPKPHSQASTVVVAIKKRSHIAFADDFPRRHRSSNISTASRRTRSQTLSVSEEVGEEHVRRLRALFHACDADEDAALTPNELLVLLELIGATAAEARAFEVAASAVSGEPDPCVSFEDFLGKFRPLIVRYANERRPLPAPSFVELCRPLKHGFLRCDTNGDREISRTELEIALQKIGLVFSDQELENIQVRLDPNGDGRIEWSDFLYTAWQDSLDSMGVYTSPLGEYFSIELFADLPTFIRASPVRLGRKSVRKRSFRRGAMSLAPSSSPTTDDTLTAAKSYVSRMERMGVEFLTRVSKKRVARVKRATVTADVRANSLGRRASVSGPPTTDVVEEFSVLPRQTLLVTHGARGAFPAPSGAQKTAGQDTTALERRHGFSVVALQQIRRIETAGTLLGALIGLLSGLLSISLELVLLEPGAHEGLLYYVYLLLINIAVSLLEVAALYATAVICAFRLTVCAGLTLYPLDHEREFLARAVARAALQVGHRKDTLFGMDPMRGSPRIVLLLTFLVYKSKRYVLKFLLKLFIKRVLWRAAARAALSFTVLPINGITNAWTLRRVLRNCRVSIFGPPCAIAALEAFLLEDACFMPTQRVDYMRVLGCCLVCKRAVHPNVEIMVSHLRHRWMRPEAWPTSDEGCTCISAPEDPCMAHALDDNELFLAGLRALRSSASSLGPMAMRVTMDRRSSFSRLLEAPQHLRNLFFLLVVTLIIDGNLDWSDRRFYVKACQAARVLNRWSGVLQLKQTFVEGRGIDMDAVFALVEPDAEGESTLPNVGGDKETDGDGDLSEQQRKDSASVPLSESLSYLVNWLAPLLSC